MKNNKEIFSVHRIRIILFILSVLLITEVNAQTQIVYDNFGTTTQNPISRAGWTAVNGGSSDWELRTSSGSSGYTGASGGAHVYTSMSGNNKTKTLTYSNTVSTQGYDLVTVSFGAIRSGTINSLSLLYSINGTTYTSVATISLSTSWTLYSYDLPAAALNQSDVRIRFSIVTNNQSSRYIKIDDFRISGTSCNVTSFPFSQSFDGTTFPPSCWTITNAGSGNNWTRSTSTPYAGAGTMFYGYSTSAAANTWAFTPGCELQAGHKYTVSFYQKVASATYPEKLKITVGNDATVAAQTTTIWNNAGGSGLTNTTYTLRTADFVCSSAGTYYFAFNCYSDADMYNLFVDEISIADAGISCDFTTSRTGGYTGQTFNFTDISGTATSWSWNFGVDATPSTANTQGPHNVTYSTPGLKTVSLTINGSITNTKTDLISVVTPIPPRELSADITGFADVNLSWISPALNESFEPYDDFDLSFGGYTFIDGDGGVTYGIQDVTFPNSAYSGSYIIFNPTQTTPAMTASWAAHSGQKYAACFAALTASAPNNDWIITPKVKIASGEQLKFWAKSITDQYGLERFKVGISTTGTLATDFTIISTGSYVEAPITWTEYTYDLASYIGQEIYIGINCVSNDAFCFQLDDLSISGGPSDSPVKFSYNFEEAGSIQPLKAIPAVPGPVATTDNDSPTSFTTYKVFRDGSEIANVSGFSYTDADLVPGTYDYTVKAVYTDPAAESAAEGPAQAITTITRWTGNTSSDWQIAGNWRTGAVPGSSANIGIPGSGITNFPEVTSTGTECNNLIIKSGANLVINADASLSVNGILTNETGVTGLRIKSNATGTGSLNHQSDNVPATVERYIANDWKWHFLSSPVASQLIWPSFAPDPGAGLNFGSTWNWDFYYWNPNANISNSLYWANLRKENGDYNDNPVDQSGSVAGFGNAVPEFTSGRGYLVAYNTDWNTATGSPSTHEFIGNLNNGNLNRPIQVGENSFNLVGNPYVSAIDWKSTGWAGGRSNLNENAGGYDYWIWNDIAGNYGVFNSTGADNSGTLDVGRTIAPHQAFFVQAESDGNLSFNNDIRTISNQVWLKNTETESNVLRIKISTPSSGYSDEMIVEFNPSFTLGGSTKFWSFYTEAPEIYALNGESNYSISRYANLAENLIIPLGIKTSNDNYVIEASNIQDFALTEKIFLEDLSTNALIDLKKTPSYSFTGGEGHNTGRFRLIFEASTGITDEGLLHFNVYASGKSVFISQSGYESKINIQILNVSGQSIYQRESILDELTRIELNVTPGVYIVKIQSEGKVTSTKVVIR